ncbi:MAG: GNAT family N-acetyltransferase [Myxococcota bacterium]
MTSELSSLYTHADSERVAVRLTRFDEQERLLRWLDEGLRNGRHGRLAAEYGSVLGERGATLQVVATADGRFVSHTMARRIDVHAAGIRAHIGMIGLVYTDPAFRRRGLAARCIRVCEELLAGQGAALVALWSDRHDYYARLGYHLRGVERSYTIDANSCSRALEELTFEGAVTAPEAGDWAALAALYRAKPSRAERGAEYLHSLASGPDCRLVVARRGGRAVAYAACGRGDDFPGVVHEWAGEPGGVVACLAALLAGREQLGWLTGPGDDAPEPALRAAGATFVEGGFALTKPLRPEALWRGLVQSEPSLRSTRLARVADGFLLDGPRGARVLAAEEVDRLLLGPGESEAILAVLPQSQRRLLASRLPWPLFIWGFDSI